VSSVWFEVFSETGKFESTNQITRNKNVEYKFESNTKWWVCYFEPFDYRYQYQNEAYYKQADVKVAALVAEIKLLEQNVELVITNI